MQNIPVEIQGALAASAASAICVPFAIDGSLPRACLFRVLPADAACLSQGSPPDGPFAVQLKSDLYEHENGTAIVLELHIATPVEPLDSVMLFLTGNSSVHLEAMNLLSEQQMVALYVSDANGKVLWQQSIPIDETFQLELTALINEAVTRDAVIRMTERYDANVVLDAIENERAFQ